MKIDPNQCKVTESVISRVAAALSVEGVDIGAYRTLLLSEGFTEYEAYLAIRAGQLVIRQETSGERSP